MSLGRKGLGGLRRFLPRVENLEDRTVPSGNVTAAANGGSLVVTGDNAGNKILVASMGDDAVLIRSVDGTTTINGQAGPVVVDGLDGGYHFDMLGGDDTLFFDNPRHDGFLSVDLGDGNDTFILNNSDARMWTSIFGGAGNDFIMLGNSGFPKGVSIDSGAGNDQVTVMQIGAMDFRAVNPSGNDFFNNQKSALISSSVVGFVNGSRADDTQAPMPTLTSDAGAATNTSPIPFMVDFDEDVFGFDAADILVTNGTVSSFTKVDGSTYRFGVTPSGQGAVSATVAAGGATDFTGNANAASETVTRTFDTIAPTVTVTPRTTNDTTPTLTGTVNDPTATVTVRVNNQTYAALVLGNTWTVNVTQTLANGTYSVTATATDAAGNSNSATSPSGLIVDAGAPAITLTSNPASPTNAASVTLTIAFSETVTGFDATDINVGATAAASNFQVVDDKTFKIDLARATDGNITVSIAAGAAADAAGNQSLAANATILIDRSLPTGTINAAGNTAITGTSTDPNTPSAGVQKVEVSIKDSMGNYFTGPGGFNTTMETFFLANTADNFANWSFNFATAGIYTVRAKITDKAGNQSVVSQTVTIEQTAPTVAIDTPQTTPNVVTGTSGDADTGVASVFVSVQDSSTSKYLSVSGFFDSATQVFLPATNTSGSTAFATWQLSVPGSGPYVVTAKATDGAGNTATDTKTVTLTDTAAPIAAITSTKTGPTNATTIPVSVVFNEDVTGFDLSDLVGAVINGTASNLQSTDARHYTFDITPDGTDGSITFTLAAGAVQDASGNPNAQATFTIAFDDTAPSVAIDAGPSSGKVTGSASDPATAPGSAVASVVVSVFNGTKYLTSTGFNSDTEVFLPATNTAGGSNPAFSTWSLTVADGTYTVKAKATDAAGNVTTTTMSGFVVDSVAPAKPTLNLDADSDSGTVGDLRTDAATVTLTGNAEAGTTVKLFAVTAPGTPGSGAPLATTTALANGTYSFTNVNLAVGPNSFAVQAVDAANNASTTFAQTFTRNTAPTVANAIGTQNTTASAANLTFNLGDVFADAERVVRFSTTYPTGQTGNIDINLFADAAPDTVANFLAYVNSTTASQNYNGSIFHRLAQGFVLQGGGFKFNDSGTTTATAFPAITKFDPINDEPGISNTLGTIAMARSGANTATSEFFFNLGDNSTNLDSQAGGFTVFGQVMNGGQQVLNSISTTMSTFPGPGLPGADPFPVRQGANTTNFPANINAGDLAFVTTAAELTAVQRMTFTVVGNTVPAVAAAAITNGTLTVDPKAAGTTVITVRATDLDGSSVDMQVTINVS
jgi:cyclophilin family peptidyl-prolyl cis-trans isomerase